MEMTLPMMMKSKLKAVPSISGNLLVVDDAPSILIILKSFLAGDRCRLFAAENGAKALEILERESIDLVLLDILMPEMGGYEVCRQLRANERTKDIPVIFLTGLGRKEEIVRGLEVGGSDYLIKPFDREELILRVRHHLQAYDNHRRLKRMNHEQRIFNLALNEELQRQTEQLEALRRQVDALGQSESADLRSRISGVESFFRNVRQWSDLLSGRDATMRSLLSFQREMVWEPLRQLALEADVGFELDGDESTEVFADVRMVSLMFDLLFPWVIQMAQKPSKLILRTVEGEDSVVVEITWRAASDVFDAIPGASGFSGGVESVELAEQIPLQLGQLIMKRHYGELKLSCDEPDGARISLVFPNT